MKKLTLPLLVLMMAALAVTVFSLTGCQDSGRAANGGETVKYTCPMHPDVVKDSPGNCPKCGMKLVVVQPAAGNGKSHRGCCGT